jgi:glycosyltransferase involved in cell wall biosynthesis
MHVAYLINQYPGISHTFIRREIQALERHGVKVSRFAARLSKQGIVSEEDKAEAALTRYIVGAGAFALMRAIAASLLKRPGQSLAALALAVRLGWRSDAGLLRHIIYYGEALALAAWLRAASLSHVHAHFGTNSAAVALLAARINGAGYSMTVHGPEEFDKADGIALAEKVKRARFVVAVSSYGVSQLRRLVPPEYWERIKIVRCGVEKDFCSGESRPMANRPRFVSVGRLAEQKGQATLIEAIAILKGERRDFSVSIIGDGELRGALEKAARERGVADCVSFDGWRTPADVRAALESARALVLPSYAEGLPVTIMEAFCLGRPVISTWVAGIPELVIPAENGWLAPAGDAAALARAMAEALDAPEDDLLAKGRAGKARVAAMHDIDVIAVELKSLFARCAEVR